MRYFILTLLTLSFAFAGDAKPLPADAQKAVDAMEVQINKARQECLVKLNKCIMDITKTGNLEAAMVVKAKETEIMDAMPKLDLFGDQHGVVGKWIGPGWDTDIKPDGTVNTAGKWEIVGNKLILSWKGNGTVCTFNLPIKNNTLNGSNNKGGSLTITKVVAK
jgi:hypothetical protein